MNSVTTSQVCIDAETLRLLIAGAQEGIFTLRGIARRATKRAERSGKVLAGSVAPRTPTEEDLDRVRQYFDEDQQMLERASRQAAILERAITVAETALEQQP